MGRMEEDPYRPPRSEPAPEAVPEAGRRWRLEGRRLQFRSEARLPAVDLLNGRRGPGLVEVRQPLRAGSAAEPGFVVGMVLLGLAVGLAPLWWPRLGMPLGAMPLWLPIGLFVGVLAVAVVVQARGEPVALWFHWDLAALARRRRAGIAATGLNLGGIALIVFGDAWGVLGTGGAGEALRLPLGLGLILIGVILRFAAPQLRARRLGGGWYELQGLPRRALERLGSIGEEGVAARGAGD